MTKMLEIGQELDDETIAFLEEKLGASINPRLETEEEYNRAMFYLKCCGVQKSLKDSYKPSTEIASKEDCFFSKEKVDALFENVYAHALEYKKATDEFEGNMLNGIIPSDEDLMKFTEFTMARMPAYSATLNESLVSELHDTDASGEDIGNIKHVTSTSMEKFTDYFDAFPELVENMGKNYRTMYEKARNSAALILPQDHNERLKYFPFIEEHPKAVLALAIVAEVAGKDKFQVSSVEDLQLRCQHPAIVAYADKLAFNDIGNSSKALKEQIQYDVNNMKQQGKEFGIRDVASKYATAER